jgi:GntR family transcriptional regulator, histidine utilization repressor
MTAHSNRAAETTAGLPLYIGIQRHLQALIASGEWPPGRRVPSELELQERYGCSRMTVNKALSALAGAGLIERRRKAGSVVAAPRSQHSVLEIHDIKAEVAAAGEDHRFEVLARDERPAGPQDAGRLGVPATTPLLALTVLHFASDAPWVLEERLINLAFVPSARTENFTASPPGTWLLDLIPWTDAEHVISAASADAPAARLLRLAKGAACLVIERRTWQAGQPITAVRLIYPGDRHKLVSRFNPAAPL